MPPPPSEATPTVPGDPAARVTVVCSPRDHHHDALQGLESVLADIGAAYELVYVLGRPPRKVGTALRRRLAEVGATVLDEGRHLTPTEAHTLGLAQARTEYVAFIDNDTVVAPGWLGALVACADETGAALVGPLQFIGPLDQEHIHVAGGFLDLDDSVRPRPLRIDHRYQGLLPQQVPEPLVRQRCDFAEFHCLLARRSVLEAIGGFDPRLLSAREVEDLALRVAEHGGTVWFEPAARATFLPPTELHSWADVGFLARRWSERANRQSFEHFLAKHDLDPADLSALGFVNGLRRPLFGWIRRAVAKLGVTKLTKGVDYGLHLMERPVNRILVRPGATRY